MTTPETPRDMVAWARRRLLEISAAAGLAVVLLVVRLVVPAAAPVTSVLGFCVAAGALVAAYSAGRRVRELNVPTGVDAERAGRLREAIRSGTAVAPEDLPTARAAYGAGIAEWTRLSWTFAALLHLGLAAGLASVASTWLTVIMLVIAAFGLGMGTVAVLSVRRLRARLSALLSAGGAAPEA